MSPCGPLSICTKAIYHLVVEALCVTSSSDIAHLPVQPSAAPPLGGPRQGARYVAGMGLGGEDLYRHGLWHFFTDYHAYYRAPSLTHAEMLKIVNP